MSTRTPVVLFVAWVTVAIALGAQAPAAPPDDAWTIPSTEAIRTILAHRLARNGVGIVVGVIDPGGRRIIAQGRTGAPDRRPLDGDSLFQIGSVTKVFTGLLLADMVVRGEVMLEDPVSRYLPAGVTMPQRGRPITLIDLSKHWSALPSMPLNFALTAEPNPYEAYTVEQLYRFLSTYQLQREPGRQQYSNFGVALLGRLLARHVGLDYEDLLRQRVLQVITLTSTGIAMTADQRRRTVPGHDRFLAPVDTWFMKEMPASGSLWSSANDLLAFLSFHLGLRDSSLRPAMLLQRVPGRALGWAASRLGNETVYGHSGGKEGYRSAVIFNPRTQTGVVVLTNARTDDPPWDLAKHLLFRGSPLPPAPPAPERPRFVTLPDNVLTAMAGDYRIDSTQTLRIAAKGAHLLVDSQGEGVDTVFAVSDRHFVSNTSDRTLTFEADRGGRIIALVRRSGDLTQRAVRILKGAP